MTTYSTSSLMAATIDALPDGILVADLGGHVEACNEAAVKLLGLEKVPHHLNELRPAFANSRIFNPELNIGAGRSGRRYRMRNGHVVELRKSNRIENGVKSGQVWTIRPASQICDQRAQREREENLQAIAELIPQLVFICDRNGLNTYFNQQWVNYTGLSLEESHGHGWSKAFHEDDQTTGSHTKTEAVPYETECRIRRQDGVYRWHLIRGFPIMQGRNRLARWIGTCTDIHDIKMAEEKLRDHADEAARARDLALEAARVKSEFLANMSHEIRTPMNGVIGMTSILGETSLTPTQHEFVNTIQRSAESLLSIINDILDFSKIEACKMQIEQVEFSLRSCIEETVELMASRASSKSLELNSYLPADFPELLVGDGGRIRQIVTNLVGNAVKFTEYGEVFVNVNLIGGTEDQVLIRIEVQDTGIGIPADRCETIFESFTQADGSMSRRFGGTGLGLTLVKQLAELMGGSVGVASIEGKGSSFRVDLPLKLVRTRSEYDSPDNLQGHSCLVLTKSETTAKVIGDQMTAWGCSVRKTFSVDEALRIGSTFAPKTILFLDFDFRDSQKAFRELGAFQNEPVVLLVPISAQSTYFNKLDTRSLILRKPVRRDNLKRIVLQFLNPIDQTEPESKLAKAGPELGLKILVAEDNPVNALIIQKFLVALGCHFVCVQNGLEVLDEVARGNFDLVLMDVQMPIMDGLEATRLLRSSHEASNGDLPIIALTAHAQSEDRERCINAGMNDYLSKPLRRSDLESKLCTWKTILDSRSLNKLV